MDLEAAASVLYRTLAVLACPITTVVMLYEYDDMIELSIELYDSCIMEHTEYSSICIRA